MPNFTLIYLVSVNYVLSGIYLIEAMCDDVRQSKNLPIFFLISENSFFFLNQTKIFSKQRRKESTSVKHSEISHFR